MDDDCQHHEVITKKEGEPGVELGVCTKCGQEKIYYWGKGWDQRESHILKPGRLPEKEVPVTNTASGEKVGPKGRLNATDREELLRIGVNAFAKKHGYKAKGMLKRRYQELLAERKAAEEASQPIPEPLTPEPDQELETIRSCVSAIEQHKPPAVRRILTYLGDRYKDRFPNGGNPLPAPDNH